MATSGTLNPGGGYEGRHLYMTWSLQSQSSDGATSKIYWQLVSTGGSSGWYYHHKEVLYINGSCVYNNTANTKRYTGVIASGYATISHNNKGDASFSARIIAAIYTNAANEDGSTSWSLPRTPRAGLWTEAEIAAAAPTQAQCAVTLSELPSAPGYAVAIEWYNGNTLIETVQRASTSPVTSYSKNFTGLLPNTTYTLKAVIKSGTVELLTKTVTITTPQETGAIACVADATYVTVNITGMFDTPNYVREIDFYYKKSEDTDYVLHETASAQGTTASANIVGLISNESYDFKVNILNGTTVLKTLVATEETIQDTSLIPNGIINKVTQQLGTRNCVIEWAQDKNIAGTTFKLLAKADGESVWTELAVLATKPQTVEAHAGDTDIEFKISSENAGVIADTTNYSNVVEIYVRDDFVWDSAKTQGGTLSITANEWNRLRDYVVAKNPTAVIPTVRAGDPITAATYNTMKNAIGVELIEDKAIGDAVTAADIDALRTGVNA